MLYSLNVEVKIEEIIDSCVLEYKSLLHLREKLVIMVPKQYLGVVLKCCKSFFRPIVAIET